MINSLISKRITEVDDLMLGWLYSPEMIEKVYLNDINFLPWLVITSQNNVIKSIVKLCIAHYMYMKIKNKGLPLTRQIHQKPGLSDVHYYCVINSTIMGFNNVMTVKL